MKTVITIKIAGEAGQGMQTIGLVLCRIFKKAGLNIFASQNIMSRIRGGNNVFELSISVKPIHSCRQYADIVIALDKSSVSLHRKNMAQDGLMIFDQEKFKVTETNPALFHVPFYAMASEKGGSEMFVSASACGIIASLTRLDFDSVAIELKNTFSDKQTDVIEKNIQVAKTSFDFMQNNFQSNRFAVIKKKTDAGLLMSGHEAVALGAIKAGLKFYSAYPMSPSTTIMENLSRYARQFNIVVEQAEDELAAINMIIGASFNGVRSMCATSGGGFALMVEGLSLAAMTETPVVIVDAQRPAPATGFPTRTEQADLDYLIHAGHGEFARVIFAPGSNEEAFYLTQKSFQLSEKYQVPVLIMTDQHLADSYSNNKTFNLEKIKIKRFIISKKDSKNITNYKRYQFTKSGISPQAIPSWINDCIYADSDEHTEEGHITEDASIRIKMVEKRFYKKMALLSKEIENPVTFNLKNARTILIGFGSTYGALKDTCVFLKKEKIGFIHLPQVWPFPAKKMITILKNPKKIFTVENNAGGQLAKLIRRETGIQVNGSILKFDGRPFNLDILVQSLKERRII